MVLMAESLAALLKDKIRWSTTHGPQPGEYVEKVRADGLHCAPELPSLAMWPPADLPGHIMTGILGLYHTLSSHTGITTKWRQMHGTETWVRDVWR